jgi:hypothetical protein
MNDSSVTTREGVLLDETSEQVSASPDLTMLLLLLLLHPMVITSTNNNNNNNNNNAWQIRRRRRRNPQTLTTCQAKVFYDAYDV